MTLQHIQDKIEDYGLEVARAAYLLGLDHSVIIHREGPNGVSTDEANDALLDIIKSKLKGE